MKHLGSIFVDSGAHSLYTKHVIKKGHSDGYAFYESDTFWEYVDAYAEWLKPRLHLIDIYVNVDVIFNPEMSWKVLKYLENTHKLKPLPVVHYNADKKWLIKHMDHYEYIGIGGIGQEVSVTEYVNFGDMVFNTICNNKGIPMHKTHGFAVTSPFLLHRYPWYSCDSTAWVQYSRFGAIVIPKKKYGKYDYKTSPIPVFVSGRSPQRHIKGKHITTLSEYERKVVMQYIKDKGYKLGKSEFQIVPISQKLKDNEGLVEKFEDKNQKKIEVCIEEGVCNNGVLRDFFNAQYYQDLANSLPEWPWSFKFKQRNNFG